MNVQEKQAFRQMVQALGNFVGADGKIDFNETTAMLGLVRPFAALDSDCAKLAEALERVRADGVVDADESKALAGLIRRISVQGSGLVYGIEDRPPFFAALFAAFQHLLAIFVAIITPPLLIAGGLKIEDLKAEKEALKEKEENVVKLDRKVKKVIRVIKEIKAM